MKVCKVENCKNKVRCKGYCNLHYHRVLRTGSPYIKEKPKKCTIESCDRKVIAKGLCSKHYQANKIHGDPLKGKKHNLHGKKYTFEYKAWQGFKNRCLNINSPSYTNYGGRGIKVYYEWINDFMSFYNYLEETIGLKPEGDYSLDRIDNDGNYEPGNIRWADRATQARNQRIRRTNLSGVKGVRFCNQRNKWHAFINCNSVRYCLGWYLTKEEAVKARKKGEKKYWN